MDNLEDKFAITELPMENKPPFVINFISIDVEEYEKIKDTEEWKQRCISQDGTPVFIQVMYPPVCYPNIKGVTKIDFDS